MAPLPKGGWQIADFRQFDWGISSVNAVALWEERGVVPPFEIRVKTPEPAAVRLLPKGEEVAFAYEDGYTVFKTAPLDIFAMYEIRW